MFNQSEYVILIENIVFKPDNLHHIHAIINFQKRPKLAHPSGSNFVQSFSFQMVSDKIMEIKKYHWVGRWRISASLARPAERTS